MSHPQDTITLAILAGGEGSRLGQPKGDLRIGGQPILSYLLDCLDWPGPTLLVTAPGREHPPAFELFDAEAVDPVAGQGPLRGILTALESAGTETVMVFTVDMPGMTRRQADWLVESLLDRKATEVVIPQRAVAGKTMLEPFPSIYRRTVAPAISQRLEAGHRSVRGLADLPRASIIPAPSDWPQRVWTNLNDPAAVEAFIQSP